jgi:hypothetical protein
MTSQSSFLGSLVSEKKRFEQCSLDGPLQIYDFCSDMKFKVAATTGLSLTLDPMGKMFQNATSLKPLGQLKHSLALIIFVVSEKKAFEHFPIGSNVNLCPAVVAILDFRSA